MSLAVEGSVDCSFAVEYNGPPLNFDIPRAVPINVERIPVAFVADHVPVSGKMSLPVVQPVLVPDSVSKKFSEELNRVRRGTDVSPTSLIDFERKMEGFDGRLTGVEMACEETVLSGSVSGFQETGMVGQTGSVLGDSSGSGTIEFSNGFHSGVIDSSAELGCSSVSQELLNEVLDRTGSSCTFDYCGSGEKSQQSSGVLQGSEVCSSLPENSAADDLNPPEWLSTESVLSLEYPSSIASSFRTGGCNSMPTCDLKRAPIVIFQDIDTNDGTEDTTYPDAEIPKSKKEKLVTAKEGLCYRCSKGNRFTEKEVCLVCNAKYCSNCILRAMGSMPEGRKCVTCIGNPIDESKRGNLGKSSRMLKRLLNDLEILQIMQAEKLCDVNQLPAEYVCVNGKSLCPEELTLLQNCSNPPKNLKPGKYWYDKVSGLWGKEGKKPSQIISPHLNVGDPIKSDASNGNTQVFINGREITKVELRMLQLAGVQCAGNPHFWVNEDGSYQEEGQKNTKGYIWGKAGAKLVCNLLSLPVPSKSKCSYGEQTYPMVNKNHPDYLAERTIEKLLLVGYTDSGTSTIYKQAKMLYKSTPFDEDEREEIKVMIQGSLYRYLGVLLEARERFEEESLFEHSSDQVDLQGTNHGVDKETIYSMCLRLKAFSDWVLKAMASGNLESIFVAANREYAPLVEELWNSTAIQATYKRRNELKMLPGVAGYFLDRAADILREDYKPSDLDILYAEGVISSNGLACLEFSFPHSVSDESSNTALHHDSLLRYQLIRIQGIGLAENCKWLEMLEDARLVIFCVSLSDYDQFLVDENGVSTNKMMLAKKFFESIVTHPTFEHMGFLLLLSKYDLFEEKLEHIPLTQCEWFEDFHPLISRHQTSTNKSSSIVKNASNTSVAQLAYHYIAVKFKRLYSCLTRCKLYVSLVNGLEPAGVNEALRYAREILKWDDERINFSFSDYSIYSTEASSLSP